MEARKNRSSPMEADGKYHQKFVSLFCKRNGFQNGSFSSYTEPDCINIANTAREDFKTRYQWLKKNWFRKHIKDYGTVSAELSRSVGGSSSSDQNKRRNDTPAVGYAKRLACNQFSGLSTKVHREVYLAALLKKVTLSQSKVVPILNDGGDYLNNCGEINEESRNIPSTGSVTCAESSTIECYSNKPRQLLTTLPASSPVPNASETETSIKPPRDVITGIMERYQQPLQTYATENGGAWPPSEPMGVDNLELIDFLLNVDTSDAYENLDVDLSDE